MSFIPVAVAAPAPTPIGGFHYDLNDLVVSSSSQKIDDFKNTGPSSIKKDSKFENFDSFMEDIMKKIKSSQNWKPYLRAVQLEELETKIKKEDKHSSFKS